MQTIDSTEPKRILQSHNFGSYQTNEFCRLLAESFRETINPPEFLLAFSLLAGDIDKSTNRKVKIRGIEHDCDIGGCELAPIFRMQQTHIIKKIFPEEFANAVLREYEEVRAESVQNLLRGLIAERKK